MSRVPDLEQQVAELADIATSLAEELQARSEPGEENEYDKLNRHDRLSILVDRCHESIGHSRQLAEVLERPVGERRAKLRRSKIVCLEGEGAREIEPPASNPKTRHLRIA